MNKSADFKYLLQVLDQTAAELCGSAQFKFSKKRITILKILQKGSSSSDP